MRALVLFALTLTGSGVVVDAAAAGPLLRRVRRVDPAPPPAAMPPAAAPAPPAAVPVRGGYPGVGYTGYTPGPKLGVGVGYPGWYGPGFSRFGPGNTGFRY